MVWRDGGFGCEEGESLMRYVCVYVHLCVCVCGTKEGR